LKYYFSFILGQSWARAPTSC